MSIFGLLSYIDSIRVSSQHNFLSEAERDQFFVNNPESLIEGLYSITDSTLYRYENGSWTTSVPVFLQQGDQIDDYSISLDKTYSSDKIETQNITSENEFNVVYVKKIRDLLSIGDLRMVVGDLPFRSNDILFEEYDGTNWITYSSSKSTSKYEHYFGNFSYEGDGGRLRFDPVEGHWFFEVLLDSGEWEVLLEVGKTRVTSVILSPGPKPTPSYPDLALYNRMIVVGGQNQARPQLVLPGGLEFGFVVNDQQTDEVVYRKNDGERITLYTNPVGGYIQYDASKPIPSGWQLADGTNGTIDLTLKSIDPALIWITPIA